MMVLLGLNAVVSLITAQNDQKVNMSIFQEVFPEQKGTVHFSEKSSNLFEGGVKMSVKSRQSQSVRLVKSSKAECRDGAGICYDVEFGKVKWGEIQETVQGKTHHYQVQAHADDFTSRIAKTLSKDCPLLKEKPEKVGYNSYQMPDSEGHDTYYAISFNLERTSFCVQVVHL
ncbi:hypothetical protein [Deinococcus misasensis]|uniref:hypothetical protein n=1 Tax=Deinococcus misasensis TaxID=392413 RepID=UPI0012F87253|nr:hypothetical protein [Deinococcus misasensis]